MAPARKAEHTWASSFGFGALAGALSKTATAPLDRLRLVQQTTASATQGHAAGARAMLRSDGALGLWRGNGLAVVKGTMTKGILLASQDALSRKLGSDAAAGSIAGLLAHGPTYPLDVLRTRIAASVGQAPRAVLPLALSVVRREGILALYRGAGATAGGAIFFEGVRFGLFGRLRERADGTGTLTGALPAWLAPALCGAAASLVAGVLLYPNDTIRRRLQYGRREGGALEAGYMATARALVREGGIARLFRGLPLYCAKAGPAAAVQFGCYDCLKRLLPPRESG